MFQSGGLLRGGRPHLRAGPLAGGGAAVGRPREEDEDGPTDRQARLRGHQGRAEGRVDAARRRRQVHLLQVREVGRSVGQDAACCRCVQ